MRLGYLNPRVIQAHKLKVLAQEINDARREERRNRRQNSLESKESQSTLFLPPIAKRAPAYLRLSAQQDTGSQLNRTNSVSSILSQERDLKLNSIEQLSRNNSQLNLIETPVPFEDTKVVQTYIKDCFNKKSVQQKNILKLLERYKSSRNSSL